IHHPGQTGLTMRTIETLALGRKLVTTNDTIREYSFYDADNILIVDRKRPKLHMEFFEKTASVDLADKMKEYSIDRWVENVLDLRTTKKRQKLARVATVPEAFVSIVDNLHDYLRSGIQVDLICSEGPFADVLEKEHGFNVIRCDIPRGISLTRDLKSLMKLTT